MGIILWLILGAAAGWIASLIMGTNEQQGAIANIVVGIVGAFIGGFVFSLFGESGVTEFNFYSLFVAVIGSLVLLGAVKMVRS